MASKQKSGKAQKVGRQKRSPSGKLQFMRTYENKLRRVNRERAKAGKPIVGALPGYNVSTGIPDYKNVKQPLAPLNPRSARAK